MASPNGIDDEIETLQARVSSLKKQLRLQTSTILASAAQQLTSNPSSASAPPVPRTSHAQRRQQQLADAAARQAAHGQQGLYRACASVTAFRVRDPDPRAVDGGAVLGLRVEAAASRGRFARPFYVLLNRPYSGGHHHLRVHRHTLPPCIPLAGLAARYLPAPSGGGGDGGGAEEAQDLARFARALRREVVRYQNRAAVIADLRRALGLDGKGRDKGKGRDTAVVDISAADTEAKQIKIDWFDGRTGRLVMDDDGQVTKMVVYGENGRDRKAVRELRGDSLRVEEVAKRLTGVL